MPELLEAIKYLAVLGIGIIIGRITMAIEFALMKPRNKLSEQKTADQQSNAEKK